MTAGVTSVAVGMEWGMRIRSRTGSQVVEFALILPILLVLVFGIIDFGLAMFDKAVVTNASREAARAGIVYREPRVTAAEVQAIAANYCSNYLVTFGASTPTVAVERGVPDPDTGNVTWTSGAVMDSGDFLRVTVTYVYNYGTIGSLLPLSPLTLTGRTIMRAE